MAASVIYTLPVALVMSLVSAGVLRQRRRAAWAGERDTTPSPGAPAAS